MGRAAWRGSCCEQRSAFAASEVSAAWWPEREGVAQSWAVQRGVDAACVLAARVVCACCMRGACERNDTR